MDVGIGTIAGTPRNQLASSVAAHLAPLIDFAKTQLTGYESSFSSFPIYFKATGGMREVALQEREEIMYWVRELLSDKSFCPFFFRKEMARVISGEEEAIYSWAAMNFLLGSLLPASAGLGEGYMNSSYGTLDLGGSSTQIAFYVPSQDISEGLYKLQIGGQKHWNVYTKSFLQFGVVSARKRHLGLVADAAVKAGTAEERRNFGTQSDDDGDEKWKRKLQPVLEENAQSKAQKSSSPTMQSTTFIPTSPPLRTVSTSVVDYCFHSGYTERIVSALAPSTSIEVSGPPVALSNQLDLCMQVLRPLMEKDANQYCDIVYHGECSIGGAYQPTLPQGDHGHFIGTSSYKLPWKFLSLPPTTTISNVISKAEKMCSLSFKEVQAYVAANNETMGTDKSILGSMPYFCFLSSYTLVLLKDGYGFVNNSTLTVVDEVNGNKAGWALGAIMHEINNLPWELEMPSEREPWGKLFLAASIGLVVGVIVAFSISKELMSIEPHVHNGMSGASSFEGGLYAYAQQAYSPIRNGNHIAGGSLGGRNGSGGGLEMTSYQGAPFAAYDSLSEDGLQDSQFSVQLHRLQPAERSGWGGGGAGSSPESAGTTSTGTSPNWSKHISQFVQPFTVDADGEKE